MAVLWSVKAFACVLAEPTLCSLVALFVQRGMCALTGPLNGHNRSAPTTCGVFGSGGRHLLDITPLNPNIAVYGVKGQLGGLINDNSTYQAVEPVTLLAVHGYITQVLRQLF